jgi:hypothetical protein
MQPLTKLSPDRPHATIFNLYVLLSVLGQFAINFACLLLCVATAAPLVSE